MVANRAAFDAVRVIEYDDITDAYLPMETAASQGPFLYPIRLLHFINSTNGIMMVSLDGVTDNIPVLAGTGVIYDITSDEDSVENYRLPANTQVYVKYISAPTDEGGMYFWCAAMYGVGE